MPNTYIKAEKYIALALAALYRDSVLPQVVTRIDGGVFIGAKNDTVTHKLPGITRARDYEFRTRTAPIVMDEIYRNSIDVRLNTHTYSAVPITDEELTLDIENFSTEVVLPQMEAIRDRLEGKVVTALQTAPFRITDLNAVGSIDSPFRWAIGAKARLDAQGTPQSGRKLLIGAGVQEWFLGDPDLPKYDSGQAQTAFQEAVFTRIAGFDVVPSSLVADDDIIAVHPSFAVLANVAPAVPEGVSFGARRQFRGYGLRLIRDYDSQFARDRSFINTFTGISSVNDEYERHTAASAAAAGDGSVEGDIVFRDGEPVFTAFNVRGARGKFREVA